MDDTPQIGCIKPRHSSRCPQHTNRATYEEPLAEGILEYQHNLHHTMYACVGVNEREVCLLYHSTKTVKAQK